MATCKLSTIITDIAGSVGGVTFRRHGGQTVVSKKSRGPSRATSLGNARLPQMRTLVTNWNALTQTVRDAWATAALNYTFPDKFGVQRHLSGRELYLKLQGNLIVTGGSALDPTALASAITMGVNPVLRVAMLLGTNLLLNSDLEQGAGNNFTNWVLFATPNSSFNEVLTGGVNNSRAVQYVIDNLNNDAYILQNINKPNTDLRAKIMSKLVSGLPAEWYVTEGGNSFIINTGNFAQYVIDYNSVDGRFFLNRLAAASSSVIFDNIQVFERVGFNAVLNFDTAIADTTVLIQAQKLKNNAIAATFTRRQIIAYKNMDASSLFDFSLELLAKFPDIKQNDLIRIYITYMNASGFRSVPQVIETTVLE